MLRRNTNFIILSFVLDLISIVLAGLCAYWLRVSLPFGLTVTPQDTGIETILLSAVLIYPLIFLLFSLYDPERTYHAVDEYQILSVACFVAALAMAGLIFFFERNVVRLMLLYFYGVHFIFVTGWRALVRAARRFYYYLSREQSLRDVLLVGSGEAARRTLERLDELHWAGIRLVGYLTDGEPILEDSQDIPYLGNLQEVGRVIDQAHIADVLVALPGEEYGKVNLVVNALSDKPCSIWVVPDYFSLLLYGGHVEDLGGVPMISLKSPTLTGYQRVTKRAFDLIVSIILLPFLLPLMGIIALAIKFDTHGPVIFKQVRVGENSRLFKMYKFRSMVEDADQRLSEVMLPDESGHMVHKRPDDPRVTRVGRFLRRISLDELPQIFNVLRGEMSLVGPRPEMPIFVEKYAPWQRARFAVPQGVTGWWQVNGRSDKPMHLNTEDDLYYVRNYSLLLDLNILFKTAWVVIRRKGAF